MCNTLVSTRCLSHWARLIIRPRRNNAIAGALAKDISHQACTFRQVPGSQAVAAPKRCINQSIFELEMIRSLSLCRSLGPIEGPTGIFSCPFSQGTSRKLIAKVLVRSELAFYLLTQVSTCVRWPTTIANNALHQCTCLWHS